MVDAAPEGTWGLAARIRRLRLPQALLLSALMVGCAGPTVSDAEEDAGAPTGPVTQCPEGLSVGDDAICGVPSIGPAPDGVLETPDAPFEDPTINNEDIEAQSAYFLTQEGDGKIRIFVNETTRVGVRAVTLVGEPAEGHRIDFVILEHEDAPPSGAVLQSMASATNEFGAANVIITAGDHPAYFDLKMTAPDSTSLTYQVNVVQRPDGYDPVVDPNDPGPIDPIGPVGQCLQPQGTYSIKNLYEPARFLGDGVFQALDLINRALSDPGDLVGELIEDRIDGIWGSLIRGAIDPVINYLYNYVVQNYAPEWVRWMLTLTEDISSILVELEIEGRMVLSTADADCKLSGTHEWTTLVFHWRAGCAANQPTCGRYEIPLSELGAGLSRSEFTASVTRTIGPVSTLQIDQHEMNLNLGVAVIWFVQNVILQQRFNVGSFGELLEMVVPCDSVGELAAQYVGGSVFGFAVAPFVERACQAGMRAAGNYLTGLLTDQLNVSAFQMAGECKLRDSNGDQLTDLIEEGRWTQGLEGDFTGQRL